MKSLRKRAIAKVYGFKFSEINDMYRFSKGKNYSSGSKTIGYSTLLQFAIDDFIFMNMTEREQHQELNKIIDKFNVKN